LPEGDESAARSSALLAEIDANAAELMAAVDADPCRFGIY